MLSAVIFIQRYFIRILFFIFLFISIASAEQVHQGDWKFDITPYVWALNMNGRVTLGTEPLHVDQTFSDILNQMNSGGMLWVDTLYKDKLGVFFNALYASLSNTDSLGLYTISSRNRFSLYSGGISYRVYEKTLNASSDPSSLNVEPYLGARYTGNDTKLVFLNTTLKDNQSWVDPILGARFNYLINKRWLITLAGDVGGTNLNFDKSLNLVGLIGFNAATHARIYLGYRYLYQHYLTGHGIDRFEWQMRLFGPVLGLDIKF